jgi:hypothetical protein
MTSGVLDDMQESKQFKLDDRVLMLQLIFQI